MLARTSAASTRGRFRDLPTAALEISFVISSCLRRVIYVVEGTTEQTLTPFSPAGSLASGREER